jgi:hypothetical protein
LESRLQGVFLLQVRNAGGIRGGFLAAEPIPTEDTGVTVESRTWPSAAIVDHMAKTSRKPKPMTNSKKLSAADLAKVQGGKISKSTAARVPTASKGRAAGSAAKASNLGTNRR